jgi:hypothetical protein
VLVGYVVCALGLSRGMTPRAVVARRYGLLGGVAIGAAWLVVIFPTASLKEWVFAPLAIASLTARRSAQCVVMAPKVPPVPLARRSSGDERPRSPSNLDVAVSCGQARGDDRHRPSPRFPPSRLHQRLNQPL